jgi:hypothetical protein
MIVRTGDNVLHLITQPDHAALSRRVMERWTRLHDVERRASILLAVEEHDNGWRELDAAPSVDPGSGAVYDFISIPVATRQAVWPRGVLRLAEEDEWAAALVAHHAVTVYDRYRPDPAWADFFARLEALRDELAHAARRDFAQLTHDYVFVRIGDLVSLMFCNQWDEAQAYDLWTIRRDGERILVTPDPFDGREVPIAVRAREIPSRTFTTDDELRQALRASPVITLSGTVTGASQ